MTGRLALFTAWALLGSVVSYGALYAFSAYGLAVLAVCLLVGLVLPRRLETIGLVAGPGLLLILAGQYGEDVLLAAGTAIVLAAVATYLAVGRARCTRNVNPSH